MISTKNSPEFLFWKFHVVVLDFGREKTGLLDIPRVPEVCAQVTAIGTGEVEVDMFRADNGLCGFRYIWVSRV